MRQNFRFSFFVTIGFFLLSILSAGAFAQSSGKNVEIVVNKALYDSGAISTNLDRYIDDLHRDGWNPTVTTFDYDYTSGATTRMTRANDLRSHLQNVYNSNGLAGTVFVGEMPEAVWNHKDDWLTPTFLTDMFFMDMDGTGWTDNGKNLTNTAVGASAPEIWMGRIQAHNSSVKYITDGDPSRVDTTDPRTWMTRTEVGALNTYFDKNHAYRQRGSYDHPIHGQTNMVMNSATGARNVGAGLDYKPEDWTDFYLGDSLAPGATHEIYGDGDTRSRAHFVDLVTNNEYETMALLCHSQSYSHDMGVGRFYNYDAEIVNANVLFYNINSCKPGRYEKNGYVSGEHVYGTARGLGVFSSSKSVEDQHFQEYYETLSPGGDWTGDGGTFGEAAAAWIRRYAGPLGYGHWSITEVGGLNYQGDPTLRMQHSTGYQMHWNVGSGGTFSDENWRDDTGTQNLAAMRARANDTAVFDLGSDVGYTVSFSGDAAVNRVVVGTDTVTLDFDGGRTLKMSSGSTKSPSLIVGEAGGDVAKLALINSTTGSDYGTVIADGVHVGVADTSEGELTIGRLFDLRTGAVRVGSGGRIIQTDGIHTVSRSLSLGGSDTSLYELQGGDLSAVKLDFEQGKGKLVQSGGTMAVALMDFRDGGRYEYTGGALAIGAWEVGAGSGWNFTNKTVTVETTEGAWLDFRLFDANALQNADNVGFHAGVNSFTIIPTAG